MSMKKVVTVTLGSSERDFTFETDFLGHRSRSSAWVPTTTRTRPGT
jgi:hypothetical protein